MICEHDDLYSHRVFVIFDLSSQHLFVVWLNAVEIEMILCFQSGCMLINVRTHMSPATYMRRSHSKLQPQADIIREVSSVVSSFI